MRLFDAHCHLQDERLIHGLDAALTRAREAGIECWICCGSSENDWEQVRAIASKYAGVVPSFGLHPWYVRERSPPWMDVLRDCLAKTPSASSPLEVQGQEMFALDGITRRNRSSSLTYHGRRSCPWAIFRNKDWQFSSSATSRSFVALSMMKSSLNPVRTPR